MNFIITLISVAIMLAYAAPGYVLVKVGKIKEQSISAFATVLMYVCQPCLCIYSLTQATYSREMVKYMLIFFAISIVVQAIMLLSFYFIFKKKGDEDAKYRVGTVATAFGNCAFMGVPLLQAIMPDHPEAVAMAVVFLFGMNLFGWTIGSAIITRDKSYISLKKAVLNPATIGLFIGAILFATGYKMPEQIDSMITLVGKMSTPLCMLIMGMRLATVSLKSMFATGYYYLVIAIKQILMPLIALLLVWWLPLDLWFRQTMFILCATPVASVVLNFAEMLGEGQEHAANMVLIGTVLSVITIPLLVLIIA